jgi:hypothetical protein
MIGEGMTREDRLTLFRAAALQGVLAHPDCDIHYMDAIVSDAADAADAMMAECDRRDREQRKGER